MSALKGLSQPLLNFAEETKKENSIDANDSNLDAMSPIRDSFDTEEQSAQGYGLIV